MQDPQQQVQAQQNHVTQQHPVTAACMLKPDCHTASRGSARVHARARRCTLPWQMITDVKGAQM